MQLIDVQALADYWGDAITTPEDIRRAERVLQAASNLVMGHLERAEAWPDGQVPPVVEDVVLAAALRGYTNPEGWSYESVDDWRAGGRTVPEAGMYLTPTEKKVLEPYRAQKLRGLGFLGTTKGDPWAGAPVSPSGSAAPGWLVWP